MTNVVDVWLDVEILGDIQTQLRRLVEKPDEVGTVVDSLFKTAIDLRRDANPSHFSPVQNLYFYAGYCITFEPRLIVDVGQLLDVGNPRFRGVKREVIDGSTNTEHDVTGGAEGFPPPGPLCDAGCGAVATDSTGETEDDDICRTTSSLLSTNDCDTDEEIYDGSWHFKMRTAACEEHAKAWQMEQADLLNQFSSAKREDVRRVKSRGEPGFSQTTHPGIPYTTTGDAPKPRGDVRVERDPTALYPKKNNMIAARQERKLALDLWKMENKLADPATFKPAFHWLIPNISDTIGTFGCKASIKMHAAAANSTNGKYALGARMFPSDSPEFNPILTGLCEDVTDKMIKCIISRLKTVHAIDAWLGAIHEPLKSKKWSNERYVRAWQRFITHTMETNLGTRYEGEGGDDVREVESAWRAITIKKNEALAKQKPRAIVSTGDDGCIINNPMMVMLESLFFGNHDDCDMERKYNHWLQRSIKHTNMDGVAKRMARVVRAFPDGFVGNMDFGRFDSTLAGLKPIVEHPIMEALYSACPNMATHHAMKDRRAQLNKGFRGRMYGYNVRADKVGRESGDRGTSILNFIENVVAFLVVIVLEDLYMYDELTITADGKIEFHEGYKQSGAYRYAMKFVDAWLNNESFNSTDPRRWVDLLAEGDDGSQHLSREYMEIRGNRDHRRIDDMASFGERWQYFYRNLGLLLEPQSKDGEETDRSRFFIRNTERIEFVSKVFVPYYDRMGNLLMGWLPKPAKCLTGSIVSFAVGSNLGSREDAMATKMLSMMSNTVGIPLLFSYAERLYHMSGGHLKTELIDPYKLQAMEIPTSDTVEMWTAIRREHGNRLADVTRTAAIAAAYEKETGISWRDQDIMSTACKAMGSFSPIWRILERHGVASQEVKGVPDDIRDAIVKQS
jgi:hypothetical protein